MPAMTRYHHATRTAALALAGAAALSCTDSPPCTRPGYSQLVVPEERALHVSEIVTEGPCAVWAPLDDCDGGNCIELEDGVRALEYRIYGERLGDCTVTVTFSDGCEPFSATFSFVGARDNCCEEVCGLRGHVVPLECSSG